jgi:hypothetical protein
VVCKAAKIGEHWTPRELRHSFVSLMSSSGVPAEEIARLAGHSSSRTTEVVYRRELRPVLTAGAEAMDRLFGIRASQDTGKDGTVPVGGGDEPAIGDEPHAQGTSSHHHPGSTAHQATPSTVQARFGTQRIPVYLDRLGRASRHPLSQPVGHSHVHRVTSGRPDSCVELGCSSLSLSLTSVPGLAGQLPPDPRPVRVIAERDHPAPAASSRPMVGAVLAVAPVVKVDAVLAVATARSPSHKSKPTS